VKGVSLKDKRNSQQLMFSVLATGTGLKVAWRFVDDQGEENPQQLLGTVPRGRN
jgi:hypothetical protein